MNILKTIKSRILFILTIAIIPITIYAGTINGNIKLSWTYPLTELTNNISFNIYGSTNLSIPITNWIKLTNVIGTTSVDLTVTPGQWFFVVTSSNFWGESDFSPVVSTPSLPRNDSQLSVTKR